MNRLVSRFPCLEILDLTNEKTYVERLDGHEFVQLCCKGIGVMRLILGIKKMSYANPAAVHWLLY